MVGGGPSGRDVVFAVSTKANKLLFSTHRNLPPKLFPENVQLKTDIEQFNSNGAVFKDGSEEKFDVIFFCTGTTCVY